MSFFFKTKWKRLPGSVEDSGLGSEGDTLNHIPLPIWREFTIECLFVCFKRETYGIRERKVFRNYNLKIKILNMHSIFSLQRSATTCCWL